MIKTFKKEPEGEKEPIYGAELDEKRIEETAEKLYEKKEKEKKEPLTEEERAIREQLDKEVLMIEQSPELKAEAKKTAAQVQSLDNRGKIKRLLAIAKEKGVAFAVSVVKDMDDPYLLDIFHDILAEEGFYKKFQE